jgi:two-component system NtrC family sensor kinase
LKLYRKLLLFLLAAAVLPLVAVGFVLLARAERALSSRIADQQLATARALGELVGGDLDALLDDVSGPLRTWSFSKLSEAELRGVLQVLCRQSPHIQAAALVDGRGAPVVPPVSSTEASPIPGHAPLSATGLAAFLVALPLRDALASPGSAVLSPAYAGPEARAQLAMAVAVEGRAHATWVIGVLLGLEGLQARVDLSAGSGGIAAVIDADGRAVVASPGALLGQADRRAIEQLRRGGGGSVAYRGDEGERYLAAWAAVPGGAGWGVLVRLPASEALAAVEQMRRSVLAGSVGSLVALLLLGWAFIRRVTGGLSRIDAAARDLGAGRLPPRLPEEGRDEVAEVSRTFNRVAAELSESRARLERWNEELQAKIDERTRELKEAQAQLVEAQKLAAIGQLGAGVAHEINNPLTGILGQTQLLLEGKAGSDPDVTALRRIEELARRSREITQNLLRFSQQRAQPQFVPLDLNRIVRETLTLFGGQIREAGVALELALDERLPLVRGDAGHLQQVLLNLLSNARTACLGVQAARISLRTAAPDGEVRLEVRDNGKGIPPEIRPRIFEPFFTTKDVWSNVGLGLSVSYRIVAEHGGRILVDSELGKGTTFTVTLPRGPAV